MPEKYIAPGSTKTHYTCPYCSAIAEQKQSKTVLTMSPNNKYEFYPYSEIDENPAYDFIISTCQSCNKIHFWLEDKMIYPMMGNAPMAIEDMPESVSKIYDEARTVFPHSPKASAALLRLALQHLCISLGLPGKNLNDDTKTLVERGLDSDIQKALDIIRVTGNNAVHPGTMDMDDNAEIAMSLFELLNFIVEQMISRPKKIESLFSRLPEGARKAIERRDRK